jgi:hypothetical protein
VLGSKDGDSGCAISPQTNRRRVEYGKIHIPIDAGERHFRAGETEKASDTVKFRLKACSYRPRLLAIANCEKHQSINNV